MSKLPVLSAITSAALLVACGGGGDVTGNDNVLAWPGDPSSSDLAIRAQRYGQSPALTSAAVQPSETRDPRIRESVTVGMKCVEAAAFFPVDYATAERLVPAEYKAMKLPSGKALLSTPIQDCSDLTLDGSELGPGKFVYFWIQIDRPSGAPDSVEVAPGVFAKPDYYYAVFLHTTRSNPIRQPAKQIGFEGAPIQSMTLGDLVTTADGAVRQGGVVEKGVEGGNSYGYRWHEQTVLHAPQVVPVAHTFYHTKNPGKKGQADVRCLAWLNGSGYVQLTVDPQSEVAVFGTTLIGQAVDLTMECNANMWQIK